MPASFSPSFFETKPNTAKREATGEIAREVEDGDGDESNAEDAEHGEARR